MLSDSVLASGVISLFMFREFGYKQSAVFGRVACLVVFADGN
jgi:hypothetical protein